MKNANDEASRYAIPCILMLLSLSLSGPNIILKYFVDRYPHSIYSSFVVRYQVLHPHKLANRILFLYNLYIFK
jgi:hypothetical protein